MCVQAGSARTSELWRRLLIAVLFACVLGAGLIAEDSQATPAARSDRAMVSAATEAVRRFYRLELDGACLSSSGRTRLGELGGGDGVARPPEALMVVTRLQVGAGQKSGPEEVSVPVEHRTAAEVDLTAGSLDSRAAGLHHRGLVKVIQRDGIWRIQPTVPCALIGPAAASRALRTLATATDDAGIKARARESAKWLDEHGR